MDSPSDDRASFTTLLAPIRSQLVLAAALYGAGGLAGLVPFIAVAEIASELLQPSGADDGRLWAIVGIAVVAMVARLALQGAALSVTHFADNDLQLHLRRSLAQHMGLTPLGWFDDREAGEIKKAVVDDVGAMHQIVGHTITDLASAVVTPIAVLGYLFWADWRFTLVLLAPLVLGLVFYSLQMRGYGENMAKYDQALENVNVGAVEFVQGIAVVKTFGQTGQAHGRFTAAADRLVEFFWNWVSGLVRVSALAETVLSPLTTLATISAVGTLFVAQGWMEATDLLVFYALGLALSAPILTIGQLMTEIQTASKAAGRVLGALATPTLPEGPTVNAPQGHAVAFDDVGFSYDDERMVLDGVTLELPEGSVTALVGPSGSGKSTLARLLCRFWDPTAGAVRIGGSDLRELSRDDLYQRVGFVFQDVQLLKATVADNIALAQPDASADDVERVARAAQIHERIMELPMGYDSVVGVDARFSGGEAQRVSIARALLADPPILVLDEATSFADPESEAAIQDALSTLTQGRTLVVIAHRLSTIAGADQIVVLGDGKVLDIGTHEELLATSPAYQGQWLADQRRRPNPQEVAS